MTREHILAELERIERQLRAIEHAAEGRAFADDEQRSYWTLAERWVALRRFLDDPREASR